MNNPFIKLNTDFKTARFDRMVDSQFFYGSGIALHPEEKYLQISNSKVDIAFGENYKVEIIDCAENVLYTVTDKFFLYSFQDHNGIYQIAYELFPLGIDTGFEKVYFKFTGLSNDAVFYSNDVIITDEIVKTSFRIDYKNYDDDLANYYQSIRILGYYNGIEEKQEATIYTTIKGKVRRSRVIQNFESRFILEAINTEAFKSIANSLTSDVLYLNGERTTVLNELKAGEREGKTNRFSAEFTAILNEDDVFIYENQIAPVFTYTDLTPLGTYSLATIPLLGEAIFNYEILGFDSLNLYNSDTNTLIQEITSFVISGNSIQFSMPVLPNGNYNFVLLQVESNLGEKINVNWSFTIQDGEYENTEYENTDYLITI